MLQADAAPWSWLEARQGRLLQTFKAHAEAAKIAVVCNIVGDWATHVSRSGVFDSLGH